MFLSRAVLAAALLLQPCVAAENEVVHSAGKSWSARLQTPLPSPTSPASIKRLPDSADLLCVWNDHSGQFPMVKGKRTPLVTAIHFVEDAALLAYCAGDPKVGGLSRLRIRRVALSWLRAPEPP